MAAIAAWQADRSPEELRQAEARVRADRIRQGLNAYAALREDIAAAYHARDWESLGYSNWDDYVSREFATARLSLSREERPLVVAYLRRQGLSHRAIASATGAARNTVKDDLRRVGQLDPPELSNVIGADGKSYALRQSEPGVVDAEIVDEEPARPAPKDRLRDLKQRGWSNAARAFTPERAIVGTIDHIAGALNGLLECDPKITERDYDFVDRREISRLLEQIDMSLAGLKKIRLLLLDSQAISMAPDDEVAR